MSRLVIPVSSQTLWSTGDVRLWADLNLLVKDNTGGWKKLKFRVDTATDLTTMPAYLAGQLSLPMPARAAIGVVHAQTGLEVRSGVLRFQIEGMDLTEYIVPCFFLGVPNVPPPATQAAAFPRKLLQPLALVNRLRFTTDYNPAPGSLYGELIVEKR